MRILLACAVALLVAASAAQAADMRFKPFNEYAPMPSMHGTVKTDMRLWRPVVWRDPEPMRPLVLSGPFRVVNVPMQGRYRPFAPIR
ncbi:MAG: hypothetical protein AB7E47_03855 [Desulfovibrionaceae bacterium]